MATESEKINGLDIPISSETKGNNENYSTAGNTSSSKDKSKLGEEITLYTIFNRLITAVFFPSSDVVYASAPLIQRIKRFLSRNVPLLQDASKNTGHHVLLWTRRGSPLRALLVVSVGTISLLAMTGLLVFMIFFVAATINAIVISLLISLAAAGGFLAIFFALTAAVYIGALSVAIFVISTTTISAIIAALITTGWIGFFWTIFLGTKKATHIAKKSLNFTGSVVSSAYSSSSARFARGNRDSNSLSN